MTLSNFDRIGVPFELIEDGFDLTALPDVTQTNADGVNGSYTLFSAPNGEALWYTLDARGRPATVNPIFVGGGLFKAQIDRIHPGPEPHAQAEADVDLSILEDGEVITRAQVLMVNLPATQVSHSKRFLGRRKTSTAPFDAVTGQTISLRIAVFAGAITHWADEAAFMASQNAERPFASPSFLPSGMFAKDGGKTAPIGFGTGQVTSAGTAPSAFNGDSWHWAVVGGLGGDFGVVWAHQTAGPATLGQVLSYEGMLIGQWEKLLGLQS